MTPFEWAHHVAKVFKDFGLTIEKGELVGWVASHENTVKIDRALGQRPPFTEEEWDEVYALLRALLM